MIQMLGGLGLQTCFFGYWEPSSGTLTPLPLLKRYITPWLILGGPQEKMSFFQIASGPILSIPIYSKVCQYGPCKFLLKKNDQNLRVYALICLSLFLTSRQLKHADVTFSSLTPSYHYISISRTISSCRRWLGGHFGVRMSPVIQILALNW